MRKMRKIRVWLILILGLLLGGVVGLIIYYLELTAPVAISHEPPKAPTLVVATVAATTAPQTQGQAQTTIAATTKQVFHLDPTQSTASYQTTDRFGAVLGTTSAIAGDIMLDWATPAASQLGEIVIDLSQLNSGNESRDNAIRHSYLESAQYPLATLKNVTLSGLPTVFPIDQSFSFKVKGDLTIHATTQAISWDLQTTLDKTTIRGVASTVLQMSKFNITSPVIDDNVTLKLNFVAVVSR
jgi:polyisoprenoid-binding protein YceI